MPGISEGFWARLGSHVSSSAEEGELAKAKSASA